MTAQSRRRFVQGGLALAGSGLLSACGPLSLPGQRVSGPRRIGVLDAGNNPIATSFDPFYEGLRELGYVEGQNLLIEYRSAEGDLERLPALATELADLRVEIIVGRDTAPVQVASKVAPSVPIVAAGGNIVAAGLVNNIAHPEGNITGVTTNSVETVGKWVELLKETVPSMSRLGVLLDHSSQSNQASLQVVQRAAVSLQFSYTVYDRRDLTQLSEVLLKAKAEGADSLLLLSSASVGPNGDPRIGDEVSRVRLPAVAESRDFAANGGLLAHGTVPGALARRAASYVDKILKGARPADLPIELPTMFTIVVNLKSARELGITVPQSVLQRATEVIQ